MKRKGIALPIDMLVILAIGVIILIAVVAVFMGVWNPFATNQQSRANFNSACQIMVNTGCSGDVSTTLCNSAKGVVLGADADCDNMDDAMKLVVKVGCGCPGVVPAVGTPSAPSLLASGEPCILPGDCQSGDCAPGTVTTPPLGYNGFCA